METFNEPNDKQLLISATSWNTVLSVPSLGRGEVWLTPSEEV
jgi:hypothetical protein